MQKGFWISVFVDVSHKNRDRRGGHRGSPIFGGGWDEFSTPGERRFYKKHSTKKTRRLHKKMTAEAIDEYYKCIHDDSLEELSLALESMYDDPTQADYDWFLYETSNEGYEKYIEHENWQEQYNGYENGWCY